MARRGLVIFVALIPFFVFRDLGRVLGEGKLWAFFSEKCRPVNRGRVAGSADREQVVGGLGRMGGCRMLHNSQEATSRRSYRQPGVTQGLTR